jgi:ribosomal protein S18 acetylase RimI-like enzyme
MPLKVALATRRHDGEELYQLFHSSMEPYVNAARGTPWNEARERKQFFAQLAPTCVRLILLEGQVIGFVDIRASDNGALLHTMVIGPKWQSNGIGGSVLEQLKSASHRISLTVLKTNPRAKRFYERAGFREVGSTVHHYQMMWVSKCTIEKDARESGARPSL